VLASPAVRLLRQRNFRLLFVGQTISILGDRMVDVALAFAVLELGGSATDIGLVLVARSVPLVACLLVGGVVADRTSRRAVLVVADLVRLAGQGLLAVLLIAGEPSLVTVGLLAGISGAAMGFAAPATTGLLPEVVDAEDLQEANGLRATAFSAGELGGPLLAGILVAAAGPGWALGVDALTFAVSAVLLLGLRIPASAARAASTFLADLRDGWDAFRSRRWVWSFVVWAAFANMLWGAWKVLGPVVADRDLGGAAVWGAIGAAHGAGAILGGVLALRTRPRHPMLVATWTTGLFVLPLAALALGGPAILIAAGALRAGLAMMLGNTIWESTLQRHVPRESLSRVSAYDWFGSFALAPAGLAIWGPAAALIGIGPALWVAAVLLLVSGAALLAVPEIRRTDTLIR
jgi:predicted MFS family arabinose efflux permease